MEEAYIGCGQCCFPCTPRSGLTKTKTKCILQCFPGQEQLYNRNGNKTLSKPKGTQALLSASIQFLFDSFLVSFLRFLTTSDSPGSITLILFMVGLDGISGYKKYICSEYRFHGFWLFPHKSGLR